MDKIQKYSKSTIFVWYENGCRQLLGAQSINNEKASLSVMICILIYQPLNAEDAMYVEHNTQKEKVHLHKETACTCM